jgi:hypothetical protein
MRDHFANSSPQRGRPEFGPNTSSVRPAGHDDVMDRWQERRQGIEGQDRSSPGRSLTMRSIPRNGYADRDEGQFVRQPGGAGERFAGRPVIGPIDNRPGGSHHQGPARHEQFRERYEQGHLDAITRGTIGRKLDLDRQYRYYGSGDVARRLDLHTQLSHHGGWRHSRYQGPISNTFVSVHFGHNYFGPRWYPNRVWYPRWSDWVRWSWWDSCLPLYDPRPVFSRPIVYAAAAPVVVYDFPRWESLHVVTAGTWVDVPPVVVAPQQYDLQLLAVRFVDGGHPEQQIGPRYRVWFRNSSPQDVTTPFNVSIIAAQDERLHDRLPQAGVRIEAIAAGETQAVDLRLPWEAYELSRDAAGNELPFDKLHVVVDSHLEINEVANANNGAIVDRGDILPVDPAAFSTDVDTVSAGQAVSIAGEGSGRSRARCCCTSRDLSCSPRSRAGTTWACGSRFPRWPLAEPTEARLVVVRRDSAAANPVELTLAPAGVELLPAP